MGVWQQIALELYERAFYNRNMDGMQKLTLMYADMELEVEDTPPAPDQPFSLAGGPDCSQAGHPKGAKPQDTDGLPIQMVATPAGRVPVLKTLLTSACERNCFYCPFRMGRDFRRATFKPDEMAATVVKLTQAGVIKGAFISSGIAGGGVRTQDRLLDTAEILRKKHGYRGYLHLKLMPGAEHDQVERAMQLADRVSVNLEAPNTERLSLLAPQKMFLDELLQPLRIVESIRKNQPGYRGWKGRWPSSTTQFVVGAVGENDVELLKTVAYLYQKLRLARSYFSGFSPVRDTPFEDRPSINPWRQHRLYQASFLLRDYGFEIEEMPFQKEGHLPLEIDPKQAWARANLSEAPVEINRAARHDLLRVPGIGPKGAQAILNARCNGGRVRSVEDLKSLGIYTNRAAPYILLDGRRLPVQLSLL